MYFFKTLFNAAQSFFLASAARAQTGGAQTGLGDKAKASIKKMNLWLGSDDPQKTVGGVVASLLSIVGVLFLLGMIYGGVLWMTSAGNETKIAQAKRILISCVIGVIIVFTSYLISLLIITVLRT